MRFGLKWLFLVVTIVAMLLAWRQSIIVSFRSDMRAYHVLMDRFEVGVGSGHEYLAPSWLRPVCGKEFKNFTEITLVGGHVLDSDLELLKPFAKLKWLQLDRSQAADSGLAHLRGLSRLEFLSLCSTQVNDEGLKLLGELPELRQLQLVDTKVTDAGVQYLRKFSNLESLTLQGTDVSDRGLPLLGANSELRELQLGASITDNGLQHLLVLPKLNVLGLHQAQVTDEGLQQIRSLPSIKELWFCQTNVTDAGIKELQQALPHVTIIHEP